MSPSAALAHVSDWVFDLDNTLYPGDCDLFAQIDVRMTDFVSQALGMTTDSARALQKQYYADHGTTLNGLMKLHDVPPDAFLEYVHDIDLSPLDGAPDLAAAIDALPGRKFVFTNGSMGHAERVTKRLGVDHLFTDMVDIVAADFKPKPSDHAFGRFLERTGVEPARAAMFEDLPRNLAPAHALGFKTILVRSDKDWSHEPEGARPAGMDEHPEHVHYVTEDLKGFLKTLAPAGEN